MKNIINKKELVLKQRRKWNINPATRIEESRKVYNRSEEKQTSKTEILTELSELKEKNVQEKAQSYGQD